MIKPGLVITADSRVSFEVAHCLRERVKSGDVFTMLANSKLFAIGL